MRRLWIVGCWLLVARAHAEEALTFARAFERALQTEETATFDRQAAVLESLPVRTMPVVRAETGLSSSETLNLLTDRVGRFDALTALVSVDYPLFDRAAAQRRAETLRIGAQQLRHRAVGEEEEIFEQTLDAFGDLWAAEQRIELLRPGVSDVARLRERTRAMLGNGQISNVTATRWSDQALAVESTLLDLELQRLDAETRLKQLMGDETGTPLRVAPVDPTDQAITPRTGRTEGCVPCVREALHAQRMRLAFEEALASRRSQVLLSAFGGLAAIPGTDRSNSEGTFGIYGMRLALTLPMLDTSAARRAAEARIALEDAERTRARAERAERRRLALLKVELAAVERRIAMLTESVEVARTRRQSVARLVSAGVRTQADDVAITSEIARRQSELVGARVEAWKLQQRMKRSANR